MLKIDQFYSAAEVFATFFSNSCNSQTKWDNDVKPRLDEAQNTKIPYYERSFLVSQTTFEISKVESRPSPVGTKTKMNFHVSHGFLGSMLPHTSLFLENKSM